MGVVDEPVNEGCCETVVAKDGIPLAEFQIGSDDEAPPLIAVGDDLEEQLRAVLVQGDEADLIHDDELHPSQVLQEAVERALVVALQKKVGQRSGSEEAHPPSGLAGCQCDGCCQVRFAGSYRAKKNEIFFLRKKSEFLHVLSCQTNRQFYVLVPYEVIQCLDNLKAGGFNHTVDPVDLPLPQLQFQKLPHILLCALKPHIPPFPGHAAQLQGPHVLLNLLRHEKHPLSVRHRR